MEITTIVGIAAAVILILAGLKLLLKKPADAAPSLDTDLHIDPDSQQPVIPRHVRSQLNAPEQPDQRTEPALAQPADSAAEAAAPAAEAVAAAAEDAPEALKTAEQPAAQAGEKRKQQGQGEQAPRSGPTALPESGGAARHGARGRVTAGPPGWRRRYAPARPAGPPASRR